MRKTLSLLCASFLLSPVVSEAATGVEGHWLTQNERSVIHVEECEEGICGKVHWIIKDGMQTDSKNPDENLRSRPMCGLKILWVRVSSGKSQSAFLFSAVGDGVVSLTFSRTGDVKCQRRSEKAMGRPTQTKANGEEQRAQPAP